MWREVMLPCYLLHEQRILPQLKMSLSDSKRLQNIDEGSLANQAESRTVQHHVRVYEGDRGKNSRVILGTPPPKTEGGIHRRGDSQKSRWSQTVMNSSDPCECGLDCLH
jgi:hypothetical protein